METTLEQKKRKVIEKISLSTNESNRKNKFIYQ